MQVTPRMTRRSHPPNVNDANNDSILYKPKVSDSNNDSILCTRHVGDSNIDFKEFHEIESWNQDQTIPLKETPPQALERNAFANT